MYTPWGILHTMQRTHIFYGIGGVALLVLGFFVVSQGDRFQSEVVSSEPVRASVERFSLGDQTSDTVSLPVSGLVQAGRRIQVATQAGGVIESVLVVEGDTVRNGQLLVRQSLPVEQANLTITQAENELRRLEQASVHATASSTVTLRAQELSQVVTLAPLRAVQQDTAVKQAASQLRTTLEDATVTVLGVLHFYEENQGLFTAEDRIAYQTLVRRLYDGQPNYFTSGYRISLQERGDVVDAIHRLQDQTPLDVAMVHTVARTTEAELAALQTLLVSTEAEIYANDENATLVDEYTTLRTSLVTTQQALAGALTDLQTASTQAEMVVAEEVTTQAQATTNAALAEQQVTLSGFISEATTRMNQAQVARAEAALSLGMVTAPGTGVVTEVLREPGEYAGPGTPVLTLEDRSTLEMTVLLPQQWAGQVVPGQELLQQGAVAGVVTQVVTDGRLGAVRVIIQITDTNIPVGRVVSGAITLPSPESQMSVYAVPRQYIGFTDQGPVVYEADSEHAVSIIYDLDEILYIEAPTLEQDAALLPARGQIFF